MSPVNNHITMQLRQLVYYHLDNNSIRNALFIAERLHAYEPRASEAAYLLALCHLRLGQLKSAYDYTKLSGSRGTHLGCSYVFAQACLGLSKYAEGITSLEKSKPHWSGRNNWNKHSETRRQHLPDAPAVLCLQGRLFQAHDDPRRAMECYAESLKLNPFMWDAFVGLCDLKANIRIPNIFKMTPEMINGIGSNLSEDTGSTTTDDSGSSHNSGFQQSQPQPSPGDPFNVSSSRANGEIRANGMKSGLFDKINGSSNFMTPIDPKGADLDPALTPSGSGLYSEQLAKLEGQVYGPGPSTTVEPPHAPMRKARGGPTFVMNASADAPPRMKASSIRRFKTGVQTEETDSASGLMIPSLGPGITERKRTVSGHASLANQYGAGQPSAATNDPGAPQRRSVRLFNQIRGPQSKFSASAGSLGMKEGRELKKVKATGTKTRSGQSTVGRVVSGNRKHGDPMDVDSKELRPSSLSSTTASIPVKSTINEKAKELESLQWLLDTFSKLGSGYFALSHYRSDEAVAIFNLVPQQQRETPWVLAQMGRAFYEQAKYAEAEKYFARIRTMAPSRLEDMEIYSTIMWHLKMDIELAFLAHELIDMDRHSPQAWCAVGNAFSLERDHDSAIKCFQRASQLDAKFAYAFTLQGHEHVSNEEYDKAMASYRQAIAADNRHFHAWYGLGRVYERQGKYDVAEYHYRTAALLNPNNAVLICCIGVVLEKVLKPQAALDQYALSCTLAPNSTLARFKKARVLVALGRPDLALDELQVLKDIAPDEANVHFLLGRVYKILKQKGSAIKHFTTALNLDPKASHAIKDAMEQMEDDDDEDNMM